ncbi:MAG: helicase-related protein [Acidobacteriota bacterium]
MSPTDTTPWQVGDHLHHRFNTDLGPGRVSAIDGRTLIVDFPEASTRLRVAGTSDALVPLILSAGDAVRVEATGEQTTIASVEPGRTYQLADGRRLAAGELWPVASLRSPLEALAAGEIDPVDDFANRLDGLYLDRVRAADGLGSFLGGRIRLYPHQLHAAECATRTDPVRWLLADEVGLGKTVEACLILNRLVHTGRARRILVVAPDSLTVQWLGELWRKHHQVFVLLDDDRLDDVTRVYGAGFSPFDAHRRAIVSLDLLQARKDLARQAEEAALDLLIVDEAHHLRRPVDHPGNPAYRTMAPLTGAARHVLLLTATPLEDDAQGFYRLLQLLRPADFPEDRFAARLARGGALPPCTSATRRDDIGGLPPRRHRPADIDAAAPGWQALLDLETWVREEPRHRPLPRGDRIERIRRALGAPAGLRPLLGARDAAGRKLCDRAARDDPRVAWLAKNLRRWHEDGDKTLIFVAWREALTALKEVLERQVQLRAGVFHEEMSAARRDIEVAQFRLHDGPSVLLSTECGGEGRNFEFCRRLVLFDLPWHPMTVEQRIGRLDRIGRTQDVEIVTFTPPAGLGRDVADLMRRLRVFDEPLSSLARHVDGVEAIIEGVALEPGGRLSALEQDDLSGRLDAARTHLADAARAELHRQPYDASMAAGILSRIPDDLDDLCEDVVVAACERFGFDVDAQRGEQTWSIEFGMRAVIDQLPGVAPGSRYLGTFGRERAVENDALDFFASGHPLIEGVLGELADGNRGRVALLHLPRSPERGAALLALYRRDDGFVAHAVDRQGRLRPGWAARILRRPLRTRRVDAAAWCGRPGWKDEIRRLAAALPAGERPVAVAFVVLGPNIDQAGRRSRPPAPAA